MKLCSFNLIYLFNISLCVVLLKAHLLFAWYCTFEYDDQKYLDPFSEYVKVGPKCLKEEVSKKKLSPRNHLVPMALGSLRWLLRCLKVIWPLQVLSDHSKWFTPLFKMIRSLLKCLHPLLNWKQQWWSWRTMEDCNVRHS